MRQQHNCRCGEAKADAERHQVELRAAEHRIRELMAQAYDRGQHQNVQNDDEMQCERAFLEI